MEGLSSSIPVSVRTSNEVALQLLGSTRILLEVSGKRVEGKGG